MVLSKAKEWLKEEFNMESQSTDSPESNSPEKETSTEGEDPPKKQEWRRFLVNWMTFMPVFLVL